MIKSFVKDKIKRLRKLKTLVIYACIETQPANVYYALDNGFIFF